MNTIRFTSFGTPPDLSCDKDENPSKDCERPHYDGGNNEAEHAESGQNQINCKEQLTRCAMLMPAPATSVRWLTSTTPLTGRYECPSEPADAHFP
jgi:hypothetical protein